MKERSYEMDMIHGPLLGKMIRFAVPLMLSSILQLLFNAADVIVVGRFAGSESLAAVGSTGSLTNLIVNLFIGLSVGTNVLTARYLGARDYDNCQQIIHTSVLLSVIGGAALVFIGVFLAKPLLRLMGSPDDVIDKATLYMQIYFAGMPVNMLYNFGSAIMRAQGDTKRPMYFLVVAGIVNVILNLFTVIVLHMDVAGVAIATVASQAISAFLTIRCLVKSDGFCHVELKELKIYKDKLVEMIRIGMPAGLQGMVFSISNVLIQSSINSFGSIAMAGSTAASNLEGFVYVGMNAVYQTSLTFASQNMGARDTKRMRKVTWLSLALVTAIGFILCETVVLFRVPLLSIYSDSAEVIEYGCIRLMAVCATYFICGWMDVMVGNLRGLGYSIMPMIVSLTGACGLRILWILTVFTWKHDLSTLYLSYPVSWTITALAHLICYFVVRGKVEKRVEEEKRQLAMSEE